MICSSAIFRIAAKAALVAQLAVVFFVRLRAIAPSLSEDLRNVAGNAVSVDGEKEIAGITYVVFSCLSTVGHGHPLLLLLQLELFRLKCQLPVLELFLHCQLPLLELYFFLLDRQIIAFERHTSGGLLDGNPKRASDGVQKHEGKQEPHGD